MAHKANAIEGNSILELRCVAKKNCKRVHKIEDRRKKERKKEEFRLQGVGRNCRREESEGLVLAVFINTRVVVIAINPHFQLFPIALN